MATVEGLRGSVYLRGGVWWVRYRQHGRLIRESSHGDDRRVAEKLLLKRNAAIEEGRTINTRANTCKLSRLLKLVETDYEAKGRKTLDGVRRRVMKHLAPALGGRVAASITKEDVLEYVTKRQRRGAKPATINRELSILRRAFRLGRDARLVDQVPGFEKLPERNVRSGFFNRGGIEAVLVHLKPELAALFRFLYCSGWRSGEARGLQWRQVDFEAGTVRLDAGETKNDDARVMPLTDEVRRILEAQRVYTDRVNRERGILCTHVFHRSGKPIKDYYDAWRRACLKAGLAHKLPNGRIKAERIPHDLRRSGARNLIRAGVHQTVARQFTGHRTESIFTRYNITAEADLAEAAERLGRFQQDEAARLSSEHNLSTVAPLRR